MPVEDITWAVTELADRSAAYMKYRRYYEGDHDLLFATEKFRSAFGNLFQSFADNLCAPVVDALVDRLQLRQLGASDAVAEFWASAKLPRISGELHLDASRLADSYAILWPDRSGVPRVYPNQPDVVTVAYDEEDDPSRVIRAAKVWKGRDKVWRATLYYPDHLLRLEAKTDADAGAPKESGRWSYRVDDFTAEGAEGKLPNLWGEVPVFHFGNNAPTGGFGRSELHDAIPIQNALNKSVADTLVGAEFQSFPQRYATGVQVLRDPVTGEPAEESFRAGPDRLWFTGNDKAGFGQFPAGDLTGLVALSESFRLEMARVTGTPVHYFNMGGDAPSGVSLQVLEGRLVRKAEDRMDTYGATWRSLGRLGLRMSGANPDDVDPVWEPAATRDEDAELARAQVKLALGVSRAQVLRELGYTEDQIETMDDERTTEGSALGEALLAQFDGGGRPVSTAQGAALGMIGAGNAG